MSAEDEASRGVRTVGQDHVVGQEHRQTGGVEMLPAQLVLDARREPVRVDVGVGDQPRRHQDALAVGYVDRHRVVDHRRVEDQVIGRVRGRLVELRPHRGVEQLHAVVAGRERAAHALAPVRIGRGGGLGVAVALEQRRSQDGVHDVGGVERAAGDVHVDRDHVDADHRRAAGAGIGPDDVVAVRDLVGCVGGLPGPVPDGPARAQGRRAFLTAAIGLGLCLSVPDGAWCYVPGFPGYDRSEQDRRHGRAQGGKRDAETSS